MIAGLPKPPGHFVKARVLRQFPGGYDPTTGFYRRATSTPQPVLALLAAVGRSVIPGQQFTLDVNGTPHSVTAGPGDDRNSVASALASAIDSGPEPVSASSRDLGRIEVLSDDENTTFTASATSGDLSLLGESFEIDVSTQPDLSAKDREILPEGTRESEVIKFFTDTNILGVGEKDGRPADVLEHDSGLGLEEYEVFNISHFHTGQLDHDEVLAVRLARGSGG